MMPIFLRLFTGCAVQLIPFAVLCGYPFTESFRFSLRKTAALTAAIISGVCALFALTETLLFFLLPGSRIPMKMADFVFLVCLFPAFLWYLYAIRADWQKKLFVLSFALTSALVAISACDCIINSALFPWQDDIPLPYDPQSTVLIAAVYTIVAALLCLFLKYFYLPVEDGMSKKEGGYLAAFSLLLFFLLAITLSSINFAHLVSDAELFLPYAMLVLMIFILYAAVFKMYSLSHERHIAHEKYIQTQYQINIRDEQYRRICESIEYSRRLRHDLQHHLRSLQGLLEHKETEKAQNYLEQYLEHTNAHKISNLCGNLIANMLVSHYLGLAEERHIAFTAHINIPDELSITDTDLSVLLGNLLENALEAADHASGNQRFIRLNMLCSGKMIAITVDNGFDGTVKPDGCRYLSTKPDHCGLGLQCLTDIAAKYNGGAEFSHEGTVFHSSVMLGLAIFPLTDS